MPMPSNPSHDDDDAAEATEPELTGTLEVGWLEVGDDEGAGQPIPKPSSPLQDDVVAGAAELVATEPELAGVLEAGWLEVGDGEGGEQPTPKPSSPLQDDVVVDDGLELDDATAVVVEIDAGELDGVVVGGVQPISNPKSPVHDEPVDDTEVEGLELVVGVPVPVDETVPLLDTEDDGALIPSPLPTPLNMPSRPLKMPSGALFLNVKDRLA
ncbi:hypothetical protein F4604DRAFT_1753595 [Suillus subluteus]|nr:hypothetical protein F4604DRAFT_1753595 [Suillus subluteus]